MFANSVNVLVLATIAANLAPAVVAVPIRNASSQDSKVTPSVEQRSLKAIGTAVAGGIASGAAGAVISNLLNRRDTPIFVDDATGTIYADVPDEQDPSKRSLKAIGTAVAGGIASGAAGAVVSSLFNRRDVSLFVDNETGTIFADMPDETSVNGRSLKAVGTAIAGGIASGAAGAVISDIFNRREVPEERSLKAIGTAIAGGIASGAAGAVVGDLLNNREVAEERSLKAIGTAIAGGIASGAAGAVVGDLLNNRDVHMFVDDETGTIFADVPDKQDASKRSLKAIGTAIAGGIASGATHAIVGDLLNNRDVHMFVDDETGTIFADVPDKQDASKRSLKAIGTAIAGGIASGAAGAVVGDLLNNREVAEERSLKAIGTAIAGGIASGAAGAIVGDLLNKRDVPVFVDDETGTIFADVPDHQGASKRGFLGVGPAAPINLPPDVSSRISGFLNSRNVPERRSLKAIGTAIAGGVASGAAHAIVGDLLNNRRDVPLFVDDATGTIFADVPDSQDASKRSLKAIGTAIAGGIASGAAGAIVGDLLNNRDVPEERSLKAIGTAIAGGIASGAAGAVVGDLLNNRDVHMFVDDTTGTIFADIPDNQAPSKRSLKAIGTAIAGGIASGATHAIVGDLLNRDIQMFVDDTTGTIFADLPDTQGASKRSLKAIGTAIAGGIASGAAGAVVSDLFNREVAETMAARSINDLD